MEFICLSKFSNQENDATIMDTPTSQGSTHNHPLSPFLYLHKYPHLPVAVKKPKVNSYPILHTSAPPTLTNHNNIFPPPP